jgi:hypothetical protein
MCNPTPKELGCVAPVFIQAHRRHRLRAESILGRPDTRHLQASNSIEDACRRLDCRLHVDNIERRPNRRRAANLLGQSHSKAHHRQLFSSGGIKKPVPDSPVLRLRQGDNIYEPLVDLAVSPREFRQRRNIKHWDGQDRSAGSCAPGPSRVHDISGRFVLICEEYAYFDAEPLTIPKPLRPDIPKGQSAHGSQTKDQRRVSAFIDHVMQEASGRRLICHPTILGGRRQVLEYEEALHRHKSAWESGAVLTSLI